MVGVLGVTTALYGGCTGKLGIVHGKKSKLTLELESTRSFLNRIL